MKVALFCLLTVAALAAEPEFPLTADSQPQPGVAKGTLLKGSYTAHKDSVFPGTVRDYQLYLPAGFDKTQPTPFMVFQDGVIYQAPVVFDNLIAQKVIPPLVGIFIKPGVVPAVSDNALPRFNRSYEYDSVTDTYSRFLIDEFLPALEAEHGLRFSTDPNQAAIAGNSSGGICAFMTAWHRPDRFRRVFTGVGTYVGIRGADRLPVLVRKIEPKPLRVFLQSGTGDNNLYCGDWWMANQMMERSLTWAGYEVNHAWGEGGHNPKHASQVFPEALRWLWRDWQTNIEVKANPKGESKWRGYEVVGAGEWEVAIHGLGNSHMLGSRLDGAIYALDGVSLVQLEVGSRAEFVNDRTVPVGAFSILNEDVVVALHGSNELKNLRTGDTLGKVSFDDADEDIKDMIFTHQGKCLVLVVRRWGSGSLKMLDQGVSKVIGFVDNVRYYDRMTLSPDQSQVYVSNSENTHVVAFRIDEAEPSGDSEPFYELEQFVGQREAGGLCVDTHGWLYVATSLGIQVCDQAGRVNFILPTPKPAHDVCFGGKDLSELFIACGDTIYKRPTKARGVVSGQQPPIKPAPPKL